MVWWPAGLGSPSELAHHLVGPSAVDDRLDAFLVGGADDLVERLALGLVRGGGAFLGQAGFERGSGLGGSRLDLRVGVVGALGRFRAVFVALRRHVVPPGGPAL